MEIKAQKIELVSPGSLIPHPKNNNKHTPDQIDRLCKIIEYTGFRDPIEVQNGTNLIVAGHGRLEAAKKLGMEKVPVVYMPFKSDEEIYAYMTANNAIARWSDIDLSMVNSEIENLGPDLDIDVLGIKDFVIDLSEHQLDDIPRDDLKTSFCVEVEFNNEMDASDFHDELSHKGYLVRLK